MKNFIINSLTKIDYIKNIYRQNYARLKKSENIWKTILEIFKIEYKHNRSNSIPKTGPSIIVSNHPFGLLDGLILCSIVSDIRSDYKILINNELTQIDLIKKYLLPIKFSSIKEDIKKNIISKKKAIDHINNGGLLITFPSGEVATSKFIFDKAKERNWKPLIGSIIKKTNAIITPVHFFGQNSIFFQSIGLLNNNLRRAFFIRELLNKKNKKYFLKIGKAYRSSKFSKLSNFEIAYQLKNSILKIN